MGGGAQGGRVEARENAGAAAAGQHDIAAGPARQPLPGEREIGQDGREALGRADGIEARPGGGLEPDMHADAELQQARADAMAQVQRQPRLAQRGGEDGGERSRGLGFRHALLHPASHANASIEVYSLIGLLSRLMQCVPSPTLPGTGDGGGEVSR